MTMGKFAVAFAGSVVAVAGLAAGLAFGAADAYRVDPVHSFVLFRIQHMNAGYVHGRFNDVSGSFQVDAEDATKSSVQVEVKTASVDTNNDGRNKHLMSPDFFAAAQFPTITFQSTAVKKAADGTFEVTGNLTLHGTTKPVTVPFVKVGESKDPKGGVHQGYEGTFTVKRTDFGMNKMLEGASDEVRVTVALEGTK